MSDFSKRIKENQNQNSEINLLKDKINQSQLSQNDLQQMYQDAKNFSIKIKEMIDNQIEKLRSDFVKNTKEFNIKFDAIAPHKYCKH
jgi:hypothetical protein